MEQARDERLWRIARKRAAFKKGVYSYLFINVVLWAIWWLTQGRHGENRDLPWPMWVSLFWGIGLVFDYFKAYGNTAGRSLTEEEYDKLKRQEERNST